VKKAEVWSVLEVFVGFRFSFCLFAYALVLIAVVPHLARSSSDICIAVIVCLQTPFDSRNARVKSKV